MSMSRNNRKTSEWLWVFLVSASILLLSSLPIIVGVTVQTDAEIFSGAVFNRLDVDVHLATMQLGADGGWTYRLRFTSEPHQGVYTKLAYVASGHAAWALGLSVMTGYQLFRLGYGLLACLAVYALMAEVFEDLFWRRLAFLWALTGSGLGWLLMLLGWLPQPDISPMDFWLIDPYPFFGMLTFPHFSLATALLAAMLAGFLSYLRRPAGWKLAWVMMSGVLLQTAQSYAPLLADLGMAGAAAGICLRDQRVRWRAAGALSLIALAQAPLLIYGTMVFLRDPHWAEFARQNVTLSPPPAYYFWGMALLWPPALWGGVVVFRTLLRRWRETPLAAPLAALIWLGGALVLAYLPWNLQRRFTHALMLPLAILAVTGLQDWSRRWSSPRARLLPLLLVGLSAVSSLYLTLGLSLYVSGRPSELFDPAPLVEAVDWLGARAGGDDVVLSSARSGQLLAARAGLVAYIGHPIETLDYDRKAAQVEAYFSGENTLTDLPACGCDWLVIGPYERASGGTFAPAGAALVYRNPEVAVYKLDNP
ncbi:MAG: hypothetical protein FJ010_06100 [Chloroflexi bacterium]|nr:hypothetical protein [Chloroflexota bacterium]